MIVHPRAGRPAGVRATVRVPALLIALIAATGTVAGPSPGWAQQATPAPVPPKEDILDEIDTPEDQASRDLERMGETATREKAVKKLHDAFEKVKYDTGDLRTYRPDNPDLQRLREAIRYYARAHGLTPNVDELIDDLQIDHGLKRNVDPDLKRTEGESGDLEKRWGKGWVDLFRALDRLMMVKARAAETAPAGPVGVADPPRQKGGPSRNTKIAIGAAGGALAVVGVAAAGGGSNEPSNAPPSTSPTPAPPPPPLNPVGTYDLTLTVISDPAGNAGRIGMERSLWINVTVTGSTMQYTCQPGSHINPGSGPVDLSTGAFNATGVGVFAGRSGVQFQFPGTFHRDGTLTGEYRVGTSGELRGQATTYGVTGRRR